MTEHTISTTPAVVFTQQISAPPETVFDFLIDPEKLVLWMGSVAHMDAAPGGSYQLEYGDGSVCIGEFIDIDRPHRVVLSWGWKDDDVDPPCSSTVTYTLTADGDGTVIEVRHEGLPAESRPKHLEGWTYFFGRLVIAAPGGDPDE